MEADMTYTTGRNMRIGFVTLAVAVLIVGICGGAVAKGHKGRLHARSAANESRAMLVSQEPGRPGTLRYYGGPKSPMWSSQ
jgi:hypothetical protein